MFLLFLFRIGDVFFYFRTYCIDWVISSFIPRHTSENSQKSFTYSQNNSFFFYSFYHIFTTRGDMFTVRRFIERFYPDRMVRGKVFLIELNTINNYFFHDNKIVCISFFISSTSWRNISVFVRSSVQGEYIFLYGER